MYLVIKKNADLTHTNLELQQQEWVWCDKQKRGLKQQIERFHQKHWYTPISRHVRFIGDDNGEPWDNLRYRIFRENQMVIPE